jgi:hypothetical protein
MMTQVPNQLIEKSHDYKSLNFCKDTKPFSFAEDKLRRMWLSLSMLKELSEYIEHEV